MGKKSKRGKGFPPLFSNPCLNRERNAWILRVLRLSRHKEWKTRHQLFVDGSFSNPWHDRLYGAIWPVHSVRALLTTKCIILLYKWIRLMTEDRMNSLPSIYRYRLKSATHFSHCRLIIHQKSLAFSCLCRSYNGFYTELEHFFSRILMIIFFSLCFARNDAYGRVRAF